MQVSKLVYPDIDNKYWDIYTKADIISILDELIRITLKAFESTDGNLSHEINIYSKEGDVKYIKEEFLKYYSQSTKYSSVSIYSTNTQKQFDISFSSRNYGGCYLYASSTSHTLPEVEDMLFHAKAFIEDIFKQKINSGVICPLVEEKTIASVGKGKTNELNASKKTKGQFFLSILVVIKNLFKFLSSI